MQYPILDQIGGEDGLSEVFSRSVPRWVRLSPWRGTVRAFLRYILKSSYSLLEIQESYRTRYWSRLELWRRPRLHRLMAILRESGIEDG